MTNQNNKNFASIPGLIYIPDFVSKERETELLEFFKKQEWELFIERRVQHYGWKYNYTKKTAKELAAPIPAILAPEQEKLVNIGAFTMLPEQVIINEYVPGQGIAKHTDSPAFGPEVASLSLGSDCVMIMDGPKHPTINLLLERRSILIMTGEARSRWKHGIMERKTDKCVLFDGTPVNFKRDLRLSVTFRTLKKN